MNPPPLPTAPPRQRRVSRFVVAIPYVLAMSTTAYALIWVFGQMWFGFKGASVFSTSLGVLALCFISGCISASINRGKEIIGYFLASAVAPAMLLFLMITGCIEDIQKQGSLESLARNWPLLLFPLAIFFGQTIPILAARFLAKSK